MLRFYYHFAVAYGTTWLVIFLLALSPKASIDIGELGMYSFLVIALLYASITAIVKKRPQVPEKNNEEKIAELEDKINQLKAEMLMKDSGTPPL